MLYQKEYTVDPAHVDCHKILDDCYYDFYLDACRYSFLKDALGFDTVQEAGKGVMIVLAESYKRLLKPLGSNSKFAITCQAFHRGNVRIVFKQQILVGDAVHARSESIATCFLKGGGRLFIPSSLFQKLQPEPNFREVSMSERLLALLESGITDPEAINIAVQGLPTDLREQLKVLGSNLADI